MFARLRHHTIVNRHDNERVLVRGDAGNHVVNKTVMAGNVDEPNALPVDRGVREADINRQPAPLFFCEAVGVDAGQRVHEARLAVVDVAGERDDHRSQPIERRAQRVDVVDGAHVEREQRRRAGAPTPACRDARNRAATRVRSESAGARDRNRRARKRCFG